MFCCLSRKLKRNRKIEGYILCTTFLRPFWKSKNFGRKTNFSWWKTTKLEKRVKQYGCRYAQSVTRKLICHGQIWRTARGHSHGGPRHTPFHSQNLIYLFPLPKTWNAAPGGSCWKNKWCAKKVIRYVFVEIWWQTVQNYYRKPKMLNLFSKISLSPRLEKFEIAPSKLKSWIRPCAKQDVIL